MWTYKDFEEHEKKVKKFGGFHCKVCGATIYPPGHKYYYLDGDEEYPMCNACNEQLNDIKSDNIAKQKNTIKIIRRLVAMYDDPDRRHIKRYVPKEVQDIVRQKLAEAEASLEEKQSNQIVVTDEQFKNTLSRGDDGYYLYHSYKNKDALIYVVVVSFLVFFIKNGFFWSISIWIWYYLYCDTNNKKLNKNPRVLKERESLKRIYTEKLNKRKNGENI